MLSACRSDFYLMKSTVRFYLIAQIFLFFIAHLYDSQYLYLFYPTLTAIMLSLSTNLQSASTGLARSLLSSR